MTSWTATQTHRYHAAIEGRGNHRLAQLYSTSDIGQVDYDARWQEKDPTPMLEFSAVMHTDQVTTPLLILHGEADIRVPTFQGANSTYCSPSAEKPCACDVSGFAAFPGFVRAAS